MEMRRLHGEGVKKIMKWYVTLPNWWDVSRYLVPPPRMLIIIGVERRPEGLDGFQNSMEKGVIGTEKGYSQKVGLKFLIYGKTQWIRDLLRSMKSGIRYEYGSGRLDDSWKVQKDIEEVNPIDVFNDVGVTGGPNVHWCEY
eukprot:Gb_39079 [translate_table: standard]